MERTTYYANTDDAPEQRADDEAGERRGDDRRGGADRRKQDRRVEDRVRRARLTPQEIAALLRGPR